MSDQTIDQAGPPKRFGIDVPGWWPRIEPLRASDSRLPTELPDEQQEALRDLLESTPMPDGTRFVSVMMTADAEDSKPFGAMYLSHSNEVGPIMSGILGIEANSENLADLRSVGGMRQVDISVVHFDTVGAVSCVTARRAGSSELPAAGTAANETLFRAYVIPQPQTMSAVLILYMTQYHESGVAGFAEMCDLITGTFNWQWA